MRKEGCLGDMSSYWMDFEFGFESLTTQTLNCTASRRPTCDEKAVA